VVATHFTYVFGFWYSRFIRFTKMIMGSRWGTLLTKNIYIPGRKALNDMYETSEILLNEGVEAKTPAQKPAPILKALETPPTSPKRDSSPEL
jgi:hypothetical protein